MLISNEKLAKIVALITETAAKKVGPDREDFLPDDATGGNIDDAYYASIETGEVYFARTLEAILEEKN